MGEVIADICRTEKDLWDGEPLIVHCQGLTSIVERFARITYTAWPVGGVVRKYILLNDRILGGVRAGSLQSQESKKRGTVLDTGARTDAMESVRV